MKGHLISFFCGLICPLIVGIAVAYQPAQEAVPSWGHVYFDEHLVRDELYAALATGPVEEVMSAEKIFVIPADGTITSAFGWRRDPFMGRARFHSGLDIANLKLSIIRASADGVVTEAGSGGGYGNLVVLDHGGGITTFYGHLTRALVKTGTHVRAGDIIGGMGTTGRATGSHLHFELRRNDIPVDPIAYLVASDIRLAKK